MNFIFHKIFLSFSLSKKPVIASQSADWRGNPFSKHMIFAL